MPTSTPRKKAQDRKQKANKPSNKPVTSVADWKAKSGGNKGIDVELPSGNVAKIKPIAITKLVEMDIFPDSLEQIISQKTTVDGKDDIKAKAPDDAEVRKAISTPKDLTKLMQSVDRITAMAVLEPPVLLGLQNAETDPDKPAKWEDIPEGDRDEDALYTDEVDLEDKMFIFQFCVGGTSDLERFREQFGKSLGVMGNGESLPL